MFLFWSNFCTTKKNSSVKCTKGFGKKMCKSLHILRKKEWEVATFRQWVPPEGCPEKKPDPKEISTLLADLKPNFGSFFSVNNCQSTYWINFGGRGPKKKTHPWVNMYLSSNTFQYFSHSLTKLGNFCVLGCTSRRATHVCWAS